MDSIVAWHPQPADETSWRERGHKAWLWVMATTFVVVFVIQQHRNHAAAKKLLGGFGGTLTTDRLAFYAVVHEKRRQICWSHLGRDFEGLSEYGGKPRAHSGMIDVCNLRRESPQSHNGEVAEADRTRHAGARGSPR